MIFLSFFLCFPLKKNVWHSGLQFCLIPATTDNSGCVAVYYAELNVAGWHLKALVFLCPPQPFFPHVPCLFQLLAGGDGTKRLFFALGRLLNKRSSREKRSLLLKVVQFQEVWKYFKNAFGSLFGAGVSGNPAACAVPSALWGASHSLYN